MTRSRSAIPLTTQPVVRIDDEMRRWLTTDAEANERTIAQTVRFLLRRAMKEQGW